MEHKFYPPRQLKDGSFTGSGAHVFVKYDLLEVKKGSRSGTKVGFYVSARCEVGDGPKQLTLEQLEGLKDGENVYVRGPEGARMDVRVELGNGPNQFTAKEVDEMIETVKKQRGIKSPGRPKKDAGAIDS